MRGLRPLVLSLLLAAAACGGDKPTDPTPITPNYAGTWSGGYTVTACTQSGQIATLANLCGTFTVGSVLPYQFTFQQTDRTVSGSFLLGSSVFTFPTTTLATDGSLTFTGTGTNAPESVIVIPTWALHLTGVAMTGTVTQAWSSTGLTGQGNVNGSISTAAKIGIVAPADTLGRASPASLRDMLNAVTTAP